MTVAVDHNALHGAGGAGAPSPSGGGPGGANASAPMPRVDHSSGGVPKIDPSLPQVFGRYLLVQRLSRGGMGEIFLAKHGLQGFEKLCVIKKVLPNLAEDEQFISRFVDEAQVAIKLQHVNVAQVFEVGRVGDEYFLAIEYVEGRDLRRTLQVMGRQRRRFPPELALFVGREIANGLAYAHRRTGADGSSLNLVHCDISPPNVLVSFEGETKIIDFGIAKSALRATATDPKMGFGKFGYMAPEQLIRGGVVDHRTDIYAAGVVLYELLTGARLYDLGQDGAPDYRALARAVSRGDHRLPSDTDPALAPYDELVARALRPRVEDRYQTAAEFRDAIQTVLVQVAPTMSADQLGAFLREVFRDEMSAHHELVERVAHLHLDAFREALTTQSVATISFALANMPLQAPAEPGAPPPRAEPVRVPSQRASQQQTAIAGMMLTDSAPTGTVELSDLDLVPADATLRASSRRRGTVIAATAAAVVALGVVIALAASRGGEPSSSAPAGVDEAPGTAARAGAAPAPDPDPGPTAGDPTIEPTIEPLAQVDPAPPEPATPEVAPEPAPSPAVKATSPDRKRPRPEARDARDARPDPKKVDKPKAPEPEFDAKAVERKFAQVSREYRSFKQSYGARLESQWTELATEVQYARGNPERLQRLDRKLDRFRSLMAAQK